MDSRSRCCASGDGGCCGSEWEGFGDHVGNAEDAHDACAVSPADREAPSPATLSWQRLFPTKAAVVSACSLVVGKTAAAEEEVAGAEVSKETAWSKTVLAEVMRFSSPRFSSDKTLRVLSAFSNRKTIPQKTKQIKRTGQGVNVY